MAAAQGQEEGGASLGERVRGAVLWRSGSQIAAQLVTWSATFIVIRLLSPTDYGLFAMTQAILAFLSLMSGHGFANALVRSETITPRQIRQVFGMLVLLNVSLAAAQMLLAPLAAAYFRQPIVADLLRVQALLYLANPFISLAQCLLGRRMNFRRMAQIHFLAACLGAATALAAAYAGWGVWTLVAAPLVLFWVQAVGLTIAARSLVWPSFRFAGAGAMVRYGGAMIAVQFCWFAQSQADVLIAGRSFDPHRLGLYTTALFLTQILASKFVSALNEVAFAAYSQLQARREALADAFLKAVRLIMLISLPFYFGLAVTAKPLVVSVLGWQWAEAAPLAALLAWAMPFQTLQILFAPATNALGHARTAVRIAAGGAVIMPLCFLVGVQHGAAGLAAAWLVGLPLLAAATAWLSLPIIGVSWASLARSVWPGLSASAGMAAIVAALDALLPEMAPQPRLAILVLAGIAAYAGLLLAFARPLVAEVLALAGKRRPAAAQAV